MNRALTFANTNKAAAYIATGSSATSTSVTSFMDGDTIAPWAKTAVEKLTDLKLIQGKESNRFIPQDFTTRAEAAAMVKRLLVQVGFIN
ncbi:hypothetical protein D3C73_738390 [compost metagenome]